MSHSSPQELETQWNRGADWLLERVDATEEQRNQVLAIQNSLLPDLYTFQNEREALHARIRQALGANTVDREGLERIREASLNLSDRASRRVVDSFAQALDVLTPEQRRELLELWQAH